MIWCYFILFYFYAFYKTKSETNLKQSENEVETNKID